MLKRFLKTQALDNLFCCLHTGSRALLYSQWQIQGRGPGASPPPPLNFRSNGGPKGQKKFFWDPPPPPISGSGSGTDPARFWRCQERLYIRSLLSMFRFAGLDIATVLVAFATKFSPFATENSSAVATLQPVFT